MAFPRIFRTISASGLSRDQREGSPGDVQGLQKSDYLVGVIDNWRGIQLGRREIGGSIGYWDESK